MICTESEAHDRWCPMARGHDGVISTRSMTAQTGNCIGAACMMWEWVDGDTERQDVYWNRGAPEPGPPDGDGWVPVDYVEAPSAMRSGRHTYTRQAAERRRGTCGLINRSAP